MSMWSSSKPCFVSGSCSDKICDLFFSTIFSYPTHLELFSWFQTSLKECGSLKEETSCRLGEKLAWAEERDSEKGDLSCHTLFGTTWLPVIGKVFTGHLQHTLVESEETPNWGEFSSSFVYTKPLYTKNWYEFMHQEFCGSYNIFYFLNKIGFHLLSFSVNYIFFCSQVLCVFLSFPFALSRFFKT